MSRRNLILFFTLVTFTSCFEIVEEIDLSADGSGKYKYTANLSQSRTKLDAIMLLDTVNGYPVPQKGYIKNEIDAFISRSKSTEGITDVTHVLDFDNYVFEISLAFKDVEALNRIANDLQKQNPNSNIKLPAKHFSYDKANGLFTRSGKYPVKKEFEKVKKADKLIFEDAIFISVFRSEALITTFSNGSAKKSPNSKALFFECTVLELLNESQNMGNTIQLSP